MAELRQNAMLQGQPVMHDLPPQQPWYRQPGYRPTNLMLDMAAKYIAQPVYNLMMGDLHKAADEYELGGRGQQALPGKAFDAAGAVAVGSSFTKAPANALRIFGGRKANTADLDKLRQAEALSGLGASRESVWKNTGWFKAPDGHWKFEIDDSAANLTPWRKELHGQSNVAWPNREGLPIAMNHSDWMNHPELERAYWPTSSRSPSVLYDDLGKVRGRYDDNDNITMNNRTVIAPDGGLSTGLHETQHAVQRREGFARGGSPRQFSEMDWDEALEKYARLAGEVEARTVQKRMNMTADERRARPPWLDYDVPESSQIVSYGYEGN